MTEMSPVVQLELPLDEPNEFVERQIPRPVGYHLLIAMPEIEETYGESGIIKVTKTMQHDSLLSMIGLVVDMGDQAYTDKDRFPTGPWCEIGQYVMFRMNSGTRFKVNGKEFRLLNDDSIEAIVGDPRGVSRV
jgi:co-chaperonin GroES (HSP10)